MIITRNRLRNLIIESLMLEVASLGAPAGVTITELSRSSDSVNVTFDMVSGFKNATVSFLLDGDTVIDMSKVYADGVDKMASRKAQDEWRDAVEFDDDGAVIRPLAPRPKTILRSDASFHELASSPRIELNSIAREDESEWEELYDTPIESESIIQSSTPAEDVALTDGYVYENYILTVIRMIVPITKDILTSIGSPRVTRVISELSPELQALFKSTVASFFGSLHIEMGRSGEMESKGAGGWYGQDTIVIPKNSPSNRTIVHEIDHMWEHFLKKFNDRVIKEKLASGDPDRYREAMEVLATEFNIDLDVLWGEVTRGSGTKGLYNLFGAGVRTQIPDLDYRSREELVEFDPPNGVTGLPRPPGTLYDELADSYWFDLYYNIKRDHFLETVTKINRLADMLGHPDVTAGYLKALFEFRLPEVVHVDSGDIRPYGDPDILMTAYAIKPTDRNIRFFLNFKDQVRTPDKKGDSIPV